MRDTQAKVTLTVTEHALVTAAAGKCDLSVSAWVRSVVVPEARRVLDPDVAPATVVGPERIGGKLEAFVEAHRRRLGDSEIAVELGFTLRTVQTYRSNLHLRRNPSLIKLRRPDPEPLLPGQTSRCDALRWELTEFVRCENEANVRLDDRRHLTCYRCAAEGAWALDVPSRTVEALREELRTARREDRKPT